MEVTSFETPAAEGIFKLYRTLHIFIVLLGFFVTVDLINANNPMIRVCDAYKFIRTYCMFLFLQPVYLSLAMYAWCVCFRC